MSVKRRGSSTWSQKTPTLDDHDETNTLRQHSPTPSEEGEDHHLDDGADYSTRMEEILGDNGSEAEDSDDDEAFLYHGEDTPATGGYREQLTDLLGEDAVDEHPVEDVLSEKDLLPAFKLAQAPPPEPEPLRVVLSPSRLLSPAFSESSPKPARPTFLHPTVSRLRSFAPSAIQRLPSASSIATGVNGHDTSRSQSNFSAISRSSSVSNLRSSSDAGHGISKSNQSPRQAFRWTALRNISSQMFSPKAAAVLGSKSAMPTVLAANGLVCVGSITGHTFVFDFAQHLKCVCGSDTIIKTAGPVTAVSLSHDHTFLAVGHATGYIHLYDLSSHQNPARSVAPTTLTAVASGRKEGHLTDSRITHLGFVGSRHTAIVSADETGLAFYHSLGKVLFVEASDVLRILGKYPEEEPVTPATEASFPSLESPTTPKPLRSRRNGSTTVQSHFRSRPRKPRKPATILAMAPLPLGPAPYATDTYNLIALLTPQKLIIIGLKPSPRTWFRCHREAAEDELEESQWRGYAAWYPSSFADSEEEGTQSRQANGNPAKVPGVARLPTLVYTWGNAVRILRVREDKVQQTIKDPRSGKNRVEEVGKLVIEEIARWSLTQEALAVQWLNVNQLIIVTMNQIEVWDVRFPKLIESTPLDAATLISMPMDNHGKLPFHPEEDIGHSLRVYKGKVFLLSRQEIRVGRLLSWADRILAFVQDGDFLNAIELTRSYYVGEAPGNKNGLPEDSTTMRQIVGQKMRDLMTASAKYAFSEDRMTDNTHYSVDGRGVDRTDLFEGLVTTCTKACIALDDFDFLFDDLFEHYVNSGIASVFLNQLEPFVLDGTIYFVPPYVTQKLIALHKDRGDFEGAERIIWHIDPTCLDINQAILMCQEHELYDALIYVYTRSLQDYVSPVVELLGLIRKVQQRRKERLNRLDVSSGSFTDEIIEHLVPNAYKIYTYLADILSGLTYPSQQPIPSDEAFKAKKDVYSFLFFGRSSVWPVDSGNLVLTSDEEGGVEPTYPYLRLLMRFDSESFLHALDIAFEDSYLNEDSRRLTIINIMTEILGTAGLSPSDTTFIRIFIARNVPKYPQFIYMSPSALHSILIGLASDPDHSTREDRQLAAEFLLSVYTPHESDRILQLFEEAGFYRILRTWHRQEGKWAPLISTYLQDPDINTAEIFPSLDRVLVEVARSSKGPLPQEVVDTIIDAIPQILDASITQTAMLIDRHTPSIHSQALDVLGERDTHQQFAYLRCLLEPMLAEEEPDGSELLRSRPPSTKLGADLHHQYIQLVCQFDAAGAIGAIEALPKGAFDWEYIRFTCEQMEVYDGLVWALDREGSSQAAFDQIKSTDSSLAATLAQGLLEEDTNWRPALSQLTTICNVGIRLCRDHSTSSVKTDLPVEEMWFALLQSQIEVVQAVSTIVMDASEDRPADDAHQTLETLRSLVQDIFSELLLHGSTKVLSFPRLFKRLVEASASSRSTSKSLYAEFRLILTGMLDSYRFEGDLLTMTNRLVGRDRFETVQEYTERRSTGWRAPAGFCQECGLALFEPNQPMSVVASRSTQLGKQPEGATAQPLAEDDASKQILIFNHGFAVHARCRRGL